MAHRLPFRRTILLGLALLLLAACSPGTKPGAPQVWIDVPVDGLAVAEGEIVTIEGHAADAGGIARVEVWTDGALVGTLEDLSLVGDLYRFEYAWTPGGAGEHLVQVMAFDNEEVSSAPDSARVIVGLPTFAGPDLAIVSVEALVEGYKEDTPFCNTRVVYRNEGTEAIPAEFDIKFRFDGVDRHTMTVAGGLPPGTEAEATFVYQFDGLHDIGVNLDWSERVAETNESNNAFAEARQCQGTAPDTPTVPPPSLPAVRFVADPPEILAGACTTLRWEVTGAQQVIFGGVDQPASGAFSACLCKDERYSLRVIDLMGAEAKHTVDVKVNGVCATPTLPDSTPPPAPSPAVPANGGAPLSCRGSQTLAWLPVEDESGIDEYRVQVQRHSGDNNWQDVTGSVFTGLHDKQMNLGVECGWYYRWRVRAVDGLGNVGAWSGWSTFAITLG